MLENSTTGVAPLKKGRDEDTVLTSHTLLAREVVAFLDEPVSAVAGEALLVHISLCQAETVSELAEPSPRLLCCLQYTYEEEYNKTQHTSEK